MSHRGRGRACGALTELAQAPALRSHELCLRSVRGRPSSLKDAGAVLRTRPSTGP